MAKSPKIIYFDLGNVILNYSHELGCVQMAEVAGVSVDDVRRFAFDSDMARRSERGEITTREFYDFFCEQTGTRPDYEELIAAGSDIFEINAPMLAIIAQLKQRGCPTGILSNTSEMHWQWVSRGRFAILPAYFAAIALSFEIGQAKPEAAIYSAAAQIAGVEPEDVFFTDDRIENVEGARQAGIDAELFESVSELAAQLADREIRLTI